MKFISIIKSLFKKNIPIPKKVAKIKPEQIKKILSGKDAFTASFTDTNENEIIIAIDNSNNLHISTKFSKYDIVLDKDNAALLMLLLNNYITKTNFTDFENFIKGEIINEKR